MSYRDESTRYIELINTLGEGKLLECMNYYKVLGTRELSVKQLKDFYERERNKINEKISQWIDENNNRWDTEYFSEAKAKKLSKGLINCNNCINCTDCIGCIGCIDCVACEDCKDCKFCKDMNCRWQLTDFISKRIIESIRRKQNV